MYSRNSPFEIEQQLPFHLVFGSYPDICANRSDAEILLKNLAVQYLYKGILIWKDLRKPFLLDKLLKLLAYQMGSQVSLNELGNQLQVKTETIERYLDLLEKSFVVFRLTGCSTNERKEITKMSKMYFWDNGIRNAIISKFEDLSIRQDVGQLWENFIISERMKMIAWSAKDVKSYFWRNYNQSEVDYVELENGKLRGYEMKWGKSATQKISKAFSNAYPDASGEIISPRNFTGFAGVE